jgi:hypothetical protein
MDSGWVRVRHGAAGNCAVDLEGGDPMTRRRDDTPEIIFLALWLCFALALGGWVWEVLHG